MKKIVIILTILLSVSILSCQSEVAQSKSEVKSRGLNYNRKTFKNCIKFGLKKRVKGYINSGMEVKQSDLSLAKTKEMKNLLKREIENAK